MLPAPGDDRSQDVVIIAQERNESKLAAAAGLASAGTDVLVVAVCFHLAGV